MESKITKGTDQTVLMRRLVCAIVVLNRLDSSVGRASAFGAGGRGFKSRPHHTKGVKMVLAAPLLTLV